MDDYIRTPIGGQSEHAYIPGPGADYATGWALPVNGEAPRQSFPPPPPNEGPPPSDWRAEAAAAAKVKAQAKADFSARIGAAKLQGKYLPHGAPIDYSGLAAEALGIRCGSAIAKRRQDWLWRNRLASGALNLLVGDGGLGKSLVAYYLASILSRGGSYPDGVQAHLGDTIILSAEDDPETVILPRLEACGADTSRVFVVEAQVRLEVPGEEPQVHPRGLRDLDYWAAILDRIPETRLIILDPLPSFLGAGVNDHKNAELREALKPFIEFVRRRGVTLLAITHTNKSGSQQRAAGDRIMGSVAYRNLARTASFVVGDPEDKGLRYFKVEKNNLAPSALPALAFRVETREIPADDGGPPIETAYPAWQGEVEVDLEAALAKSPGAVGRPATVSVEIAERVFDYLQSKPFGAPCGEVADYLGEAGKLGDRVWVPSKRRHQWSGFSTLKEALKRVETLAAPRAGVKVHLRPKGDGHPNRWILWPLDGPLDAAGRPLVGSTQPAPAVVQAKATQSQPTSLIDKAREELARLRDAKAAESLQEPAQAVVEPSVEPIIEEASEPAQEPVKQPAQAEQSNPLERLRAAAEEDLIQRAFDDLGAKLHRAARSKVYFVEIDPESGDDGYATLVVESRTDSEIWDRLQVPLDCPEVELKARLREIFTALDQRRAFKS